MLAELVHRVVGVDPDRDWITLAVVDATTSGVVAEGRFAATALIVTADEQLRAQLRPLRTSAQVEMCARFRDHPYRAVEQRCTGTAMRSVAGRIQHLNTEIDDHDRVLRHLLDEAAPQLVAERGIGYVTAAEFYIAWSHPGRCRSEAAFRPARRHSTGRSDLRTEPDPPRLSRGGANSTARSTTSPITKRRCDPTTRDYIARRVAASRPNEKPSAASSYLARRVWRLLEHAPITT